MNYIKPQPSLFIGGPYDGRKLVVDGYKKDYKVKTIVSAKGEERKYEETVYVKSPASKGNRGISVFVAPGITGKEVVQYLQNLEGWNG